MFGAQMPRGGQNLNFAGMDQREVAALAEILGQCRSSLKHYGSEEHFGPNTFNDDVTFKDDVLFKEGDVTFGDVNGRGGDVINNGDLYQNGDAIFTGDVTFPAGTINNPRFIELTTDLYPGTSATAKFQYWNGSAYVDTADAAFTVHDPFKIARNAFLGQQGYAVYDFDRSVYVVHSMNAPTTRRGTVDTALVRDGNQTFSDGVVADFEVYGYMIKSGWQIPTTARVLATWCQDENSGAGRWLATAIDDCLEEVP